LANRLLAELVTILGAAWEADPAAVAGTAESIADRNRQAKALRRCPNCDADHFTQHVSHGDLPY
jgi:hypothetical protein